MKKVEDTQTEENWTLSLRHMKRGISLALRILGVTALVTAPIAGNADTLELVGELDLGGQAGVSLMRDGKFAIAQIQGADYRAARIEIIDLSVPERPLVRGSVAVSQSGKIAVSPDGRRLLFVSQLERGKFPYEKPVRYQLIAFDLSNPDRPAELWRRDIRATRVILAPDASAYFTCEPLEANNHAWTNAITWLTGARTPVVVNEDTLLRPPLCNQGGLKFSQNAAFFVAAGSSTLRAIDLRGNTPVLYEQPWQSFDRYGGAIALEDGYIIAGDARVSRFGIYAIKSGIPRVTTFPNSGNEFIVGVDSAETGILLSDASGILLSDTFGHMRQLDLTAPNNPRVVGTWQLPNGTQPVGITRSDHAYVFAVQFDRAKHSTILKCFRMDANVRVNVDWEAIQRAHAKSLQIYHDNRDRVLGAALAVEVLEMAGIHTAMEIPVNGISKRDAAAIFNDYGFFLTNGLRSPDRSPDAELALRRAIKLDPARSVAYLNLADLLRKNLPASSNWATTQERFAEIASLYRQYLRAGGKSNAGIESFLKLGPDQGKPVDICEAIATYARAGQLQELVSSTGLNIPLGSRNVDVFFVTGGTASTYYLFDSQTDTPVRDVELPDPDEWAGENLGLVVYRDAIHVLHYRDLRHPVASISIDGNKRCHF